MFLFIIYFLYQKIIFNNKAGNLNLILISVDTLRPDHMGVYGYNKNTTPNIDKWAKDAFVFTNAYTIIPLTYPSFTALMTGRYPIETKIIDNADGPMQNNIKTLAENLKKKGYATGASVTNMALDSELTNINRGFDYYEVNEDEKEVMGSLDYLDNGFNWIRDNKQVPFFFWLHIKAPHRPYYPRTQLRNIFSKSYKNTIEGINFSEARSRQDELVKKIKCYKQDGIKDEKYLEELIDTYTRLYDEDILNGDYIFKHIIDYINKSGLNKNSIIVFYGDHGESMDHDYYFSHGRVIYNSSVKIPLMIKLPNNENGVIDYLIDNTSIHNIISNLLFNTNRAHLSLKDIDSLVKRYSKDEIYIMDNAATKGGIVNKRYKYIKTLRTFKDDCLNKYSEEFYDLSLDKAENTNLISQIKYKEIIDKLREDFKTNFFKYFPMKEKDINNSQDKIDKLKSLGY